MEVVVDATVYLQIVNVICNTVQVVALAYIGTLVADNTRRRANEHRRIR